MCLVLLAFRAHPDATVILAGNRDEIYARASTPPQKIEGDPVKYAGLDQEKGGTWMGKNENGMMAALTNQRGGRLPDPDLEASRGEIVMNLLQFTDPEMAAQWLGSVTMEKYKPFSVLFGNSRSFYYFSSESKKLPHKLGTGFYALSNSSLDDKTWPKVARAHAFFQQNRKRSGESLLLHLQDFLGDVTPPDESTINEPGEEIHGAMGAVFIQTPGYGTVSSTIITEGGTLGRRYYYAKGEALKEDPGSAFQNQQF